MTAQSVHPITKSDEKVLINSNPSLDPDRAAWANARDGEEELQPPPMDGAPGDTIRAYIEGMFWGFFIGVPLLGLVILIGECIAG